MKFDKKLLQLFSLKKIFGSANDRLVKRYKKVAHKINALESRYKILSDSELKKQTELFKKRLKKGENLEDIKIEAFAVVREAAVRTLKQRHFDVQLIGGLVLHDGRISEMKTGEGKTLVATLAVYLNALMEKGVHIVTVNDYLAKRDAEWMGQIYNFLGLRVGYIVHGLTDEQRRQAYQADITYGTNHEFGFDYLRDNMKFRAEDMVMRPFHYAIVDEVDSILIDEARTPLIISGPAEKSSDLYQKANKVILKLSEEDYDKDEKHKNVTFTDKGVEKIEKILSQDNLLKGTGLYDLQNVNLLHYINAALKAHIMYKRDTDYIVKNGKVIIIDEFTGRMMEGRRYSDGLHQAIEAKEGVDIQIENQTLASITYQNYFRLYPKLAGMSGTVMTESEEFEEIYRLSCVEIPTNQTVMRKDYNDEFYVSSDEKNKAIVSLIKECQKKGQPVLVGTVSIEKSEQLSELLSKEKVKHSVLNARYHEQEAMIIANAGRLEAVTIATNMAGRGTDIQLGGNLEIRVREETKNIVEGEKKEETVNKIKKEVQEENKKVIKAGGLFVVGTERHESRRIDNQLRGRSGRQGDPGASKFFLSVEDDLLRIFGFDQKKDYLRRKLKKGEKLSTWWFNRIVEGAQRKVEARNFDMRKHLLKYDDVMNDQRKIIYAQRKDFMKLEDLSPLVSQIYQEVIHDLIDFYVPESSMPDMWDVEGLHNEISRIFTLDLPIKYWIEDEGITVSVLSERIEEKVNDFFEKRYKKVSKEIVAFLEKTLMLQLLDQHWKNHLYNLDQIRQGINLRAYAQNNPLNEYKREAFSAFESMMRVLRTEIMEVICHMPLDQKVPSEKPVLSDDEMFGNVQDDSFKKGIDKDPILPRNASCFCGSGKRYKHCHGRSES